MRVLSRNERQHLEDIVFGLERSRLEGRILFWGLWLEEWGSDIAARGWTISEEEASVAPNKEEA